MEGGRQSEIAKAILGSKNVPYVVAAPLLIQVGAATWLPLSSAPGHGQPVPLLPLVLSAPSCLGVVLPCCASRPAS